MNAVSTFGTAGLMLRRLGSALSEMINPFAPAARQIRTESRDYYLGGDAWPGAVPARIASRRR